MITMDHEKQAGFIAGVVEIVKYTFEILVCT